MPKPQKMVRKKLLKSAPKKIKKTASRIRKTDKSTGINFEQCIRQFEAVGHKSYTNPEFMKLPNPPLENYLIRRWPHKTLYGTDGHREAYIVSKINNASPFVHDEDGRARIVLEAKFQGQSGSVDEKFPFLWESFLVSTVPNWIIVYGGSWWQSIRGAAAIQWLKKRIEDRPLPGKRMLVCSDEELPKLINKLWGRGPN